MRGLTTILRESSHDLIAGEAAKNSVLPRGSGLRSALNS